MSFIIFKSILLEQFWSHYMFRRCCPVHVCCITEGCLQIIMSSQQKFNWSLIPIVPRHKSSATSLCLPIRLVTNLSCCPHAKPLPPACTTRFPGCHLLPAQTHLPQGCCQEPCRHRRQEMLRESVYLSYCDFRSSLGYHLGEWLVFPPFSTNKPSYPTHHSYIKSPHPSQAS